VTLINNPALLATMKTAVQAYHTSTSTFICAQAKLSFVKLNLIDTDGTYVEDTTYESVLADIPGGGPTATAYPNQVALVVSLTTGFSRGPAHRGRFYLPLPGSPIDIVNGTLDPANTAFCVTATNTFIGALNAASANCKVAVFSRKSGAATHRLVTGNQVGKVLDTQRRRRRSMVENY
jgi:hypothetical protein